MGNHAWRIRFDVKKRIIYELKYYSHPEHPSKNLSISSPSFGHRKLKHLDALRVVVILDLASRSRSTGSSTSEPLATTLSVLSNSTTRSRSSRSSRSSSLRSLDNSAQSSSRLGSHRSSGRSANRDLGRNRGGSGSLGGRDGGSTASTAADDGRTRSFVRSVDGGVVDVGKDTRVSSRVTTGKRDLCRCGRREGA